MGTIRENSKGVKLHLDDKGLWHREDGPAYIHEEVYSEWCINGETHREDGPARVWGPNSFTPNRKPEYWLNDRQYSKEEWEELMLKKKLKRLKDL